MGIADSLAALGDLALARGDPAGATAFYAEGLTVLRPTGDRHGIAVCLEGMATVAWAGSDADRAAWLGGAAAALIAPDLLIADPPAAREGTSAAVRAALGERTLAAAWARGQAMSLEEAIAAALAPQQALTPSLPDRSRSPSR